MGKLLTVKDLSCMINLHPKTIYKWTKEGKVPHIRINGLIRFDSQEIKKWQKERSPNKREFLNILPKFELSLEYYDKMLLKGRSALGKKGSKRWNYGFGGVYTRKTKSGAERWCIWYYDLNHKRVQKVVKNARNRQEAVFAMHAEVSKAFNMEFRREKELERITFKEFANLYLENYARPKKKSWKSDQKYLDAQLIPFFGKMELSEITPLDVNKFMVKRQKDGVKNSTINRELTVLKKMLNLAIEWGYNIKKNPVRKGNFFSEEEYKRNRVLSYDEEERLFKAAAPHLKPILTCALSTGMRYSEILGLKWENVDLKKRQITVKAESSKSGKQRVIPINDTLFEEMEELRKLNDGMNNFVFIYEDPKTGKPRPVKTVRRAFVMACKRADIKNLTFHDLRHTVGSRLVSKGADPVSIKIILGHSNLKTTEIYLHSNLKQMRDAVEMLNGKAGMNARNVEKLLLICNAEKGEKGKKLANVFFSVN